MSGMSQLAVLAYALVMLACLAAVPVAARQADRRGDLFHWIAAAALFAGMAAMRVGQAEDRLRDGARGWMRGAGAYETRADLQVPLALLIALLGLGVVLLFVRLWRRARPGSRARLVLLSRFALLGLVPLFGLRIVSLHQIDFVLYSGPLRINWLLEGAICLAVGGCAAIYAFRKRARVRTRQGRPSALR